MSVDSAARTRPVALPDGVTVPALYVGTITHQRRAPVSNWFRYRSVYWLIDVDDPPRLPRWLRPFASFRARDHVDVRAVLAEAGLQADRILRLAHARSFGAAFNPISVAWCFDCDGELLAAVAEVHNTYGGRHAYLLQPDERGKAGVDKQLYVSPFYPVDGHYEIQLSPLGGRFSVIVIYRREHDAPFVATLTAERQPVTVRRLLGLWWRFPFTPLRTSLLIRWQGIRLWRRGLPVQPR